MKVDLSKTKTGTYFLPLTNKNWDDIVKLFGERGACGGCWCMSWRLKSSDFEKNKGLGNKELLKALTEKKEHIGLIAYKNGEPAGWCAFAPREKYLRLENSRVLKRIDDEPVWSISCFFITKPFRRQGFSVELLQAVINFARKNKIKILEAYPVIPYSQKMPDAFAWTGFLNSFIAAGFKEAARHSPSRPIMRYYIDEKKAQ